MKELLNIKEFFPGGASRQIVHGAGAGNQTEWIVVGLVHACRVLTKIVGKDAGSVGNLVITFFGRIRGVATSVAFDTVTIAATGLTDKIDGAKIIDVRGFDEVSLKFAYTNASGDYVDVSGYLGMSYPS